MVACVLFVFLFLLCLLLLLTFVFLCFCCCGGSGGGIVFMDVVLFMQVLIFSLFIFAKRYRSYMHVFVMHLMVAIVS